MSRRALQVALAAAVAVVSAGCPGGSRSAGGGSNTPKTPVLPPVSAEGLGYFDSAMRAMRLGGPEAFERAKPRFEKAIAADKNLWEAHYNLGTIHFAEGEDRDAIDSFSSALAINPAHTLSYAGRAEAYRRSGKSKKAARDYRKVLKIEKDNAAVYARLASLHREAKDYEKALDVIRIALVRVGATTELYVEQGLIYLAQGRDGLAQLMLSKAAELNPKAPAIYNALAILALSRGRDQEAFERFDHASSLDPSYIDARFNRASVLLDAGDYEGAKVELSDIVDKNPDDLAARVALGVAYRGLGKYDRAKKTWNRVIKRGSTKSDAGGDALYNLAMLELDYKLNEKAAKRALERYLQDSSSRHAKRKDAEQRMKDLGQ